MFSAIFATMMTFSGAAWAGSSLKGPTIEIKGVPLVYLASKNRGQFNARMSDVDDHIYQSSSSAFYRYETAEGVQWLQKQLNASKRSEPGIYLYTFHAYAEAIGFSGYMKPTQPLYLIVAQTDKEVKQRLNRYDNSASLAPADIKAVYILEARSEY